MFKSRSALILSLCVAVGGLNACATSNTQRVDIKKVYDKAAQYHLPDRNPIIVIPGILGSKLVDVTMAVIILPASNLIMIGGKIFHIMLFNLRNL